MKCPVCDSKMKFYNPVWNEEEQKCSKCGLCVSAHVSNGLEDGDELHYTVTRRICFGRYGNYATHTLLQDNEKEIEKAIRRCRTKKQEETL